MGMKRIVYSLVGVFLFLACNKDQKACKDAICTMEVRSFGLVLRTATGTIPPSVDYCETYLNGRLLNTSTPNVQGSNSLVQIVDDSHRTQFTLNQAQTVEVRIIQQGVVSKTTSMRFLADCCHVNRVSGSDTLIVL